MERIVKFIKGYHTPRNGVHGVTVGFYLKGEKGTIQFIIYTDWFPTSYRKSLKTESKFAGVYPMAADIGYHSPKPMYEGQTPIGKAGECEWVEGECFYDGSGLRAEKFLTALVDEGEEKVWQMMEEEYKMRFEEGDE